MKIKLKGIVALMTMFCVFGSKPASTLSLDSSVRMKSSNIQEEHTEVVSYENVLQSYYDLAVGDTLEPTESFDEFFDIFYAEGSDRDLYRFTLSLALDNGNYEDVYKTLYPNDNGIAAYSSSSSGGKDLGGGIKEEDATYILKDSYESYWTPSSWFARRPLNFVYEYYPVQNGDIVWETETKLYTGHNALIIDTQHESDYGNYIQTIEAVLGGVQRGFLDDYRMLLYKCRILRVRGKNDDSVSKAGYFAKKQIGKPYNLKISRQNISIDSESWYCSELVYAAWKYAGIDIGICDGVPLLGGCTPANINKADNIYPVLTMGLAFLSPGVYDKIGNTWKIKIFNPTSQSLEVEYNSKMSLLDDSKNWKSLNDIKKKTIAPKSSEIVDIKENWLSTSISMSYIMSDYRIITYSDGLDLKEHNINNYKNMIYLKVNQND